MCGLLSYYSPQKLEQSTLDLIAQGFATLQKRGPDASETLIGDRYFLGFQRLALQDTSALGMQPFVYHEAEYDLVVLCNGEIYNAATLIDLHSITPSSQSDCEVIGPLFIKGGRELVTSSLQGEYACVITQIFKDGHYRAYALRDHLGVRPLFMGTLTDGGIVFASELKALSALSHSVRQFQPGTRMSYDSQTGTQETHRFTSFHSSSSRSGGYSDALRAIRDTLSQSVQEKLVSDRPLCALLSGGLDSSLVSALAAQFAATTLHTFSIGLPGATDLPFAQLVADHIQSHHHTVELTIDQGLRAIEQTIYAIESYDITTVRASVWQYLIGQYIATHTDFKAILCGEVSDELFAGYKYFHSAPSPQELHQENIRLLEDIHLYDGLRVDRSMAHHGLEVRLPFADKRLSDLVLSLDPERRAPYHKIEKYLLRKAFEETDLLPREVLRRSKEAFSDGVSGRQKSRFEHIQDYVDTLISDAEFESEAKKYTHNTPLTKESYYYRKLFDQYFGDHHSGVIPYFRLPKRSGDIKEPSARVLASYE